MFCENISCSCKCFSSSCKCIMLYQAGVVFPSSYIFTTFLHSTGFGFVVYLASAYLFYLYICNHMGVYLQFLLNKNGLLCCGIFLKNFSQPYFCCFGLFYLLYLYVFSLEKCLLLQTRCYYLCMRLK